MTSKLSLYYHTLRYLKPGQVYWRLWFRLVRPAVDASPRPGLRQASGRWVAPAARRASLHAPATFHFLNVAGELAEIGWDGAQREKLWRYNQHYFDDLNAADAGARTAWHYALLENWIAANPPGQGNGWEPYPVSLRIVNWVKWHASGHPLPEQCQQSLAVQARWLAKRIEWHILGNHLFANAKALVFAGLLFDGAEADKWLHTGLAIIARELPEQVLADGGNFELSPMYHAIFLEDLLDLINLAGNYPAAIVQKHIKHWREAAGKMLAWLDAMCHPDGEIAFFNDGAIGNAPAPAEIKSYAQRLDVDVAGQGAAEDGVRMRHFPASGYVRLDGTDAALFLDVAPVGPDYLPGHAHADSLSFELSLFGSRILVNGGTSEYGAGPVRLSERGTAAHNTVQIDGENSSQIWSGFRVAQRAYPHQLQLKVKADQADVSCSHDGYQRLPGKPRHRRNWQFSDGKLVVRDRIEGAFGSAVGRFRFHPDVKVTALDARNWVLALPHCERRIRVRALQGQAQLEQSFYAPEFGLRQESTSLAVRFDAQSDIAIEIMWSNNE